MRLYVFGAAAATCCQGVESGIEKEFGTQKLVDADGVVSPSFRILTGSPLFSTGSGYKCLITMHVPCVDPS